ncbi:MAG TPA: DUF459 domain-containing protein [Rhizobiaceae bacterium]
MKARTGDGALSSRYPVLFLALAALVVAFSLGSPSSARAQEGEPRLGLLNRLFGARPAYRIDDPPADVGRPRTERLQRGEPHRTERPQRAERKKRPRQREGDEPPQVAAVTKRPDARVVIVIGDFLASGLAEGLTTAFTQNPDVRIVDRTSGSSGFVREDFHNWPEKVDQLITTERPAAIVVMIGANDRQQMLVDGVRETVRSESWNTEYAARAGELAKAIAARKVPYLWVGMPSFKSSKTMLDMLAFNDIYRVAAANAGGEFVDIWDGFVDENGAYMPSGPDINGQLARLRANDGINLARPGKRKVAFYAERPLYKILGMDPAALAAAATAETRSPYRMMGPFGPTETAQPADIDIVADPNETGPIDPARPIALRTPALDGGIELLGAVVETRHEARTPAEKLAIEGIAPAPQAGRADQSAGPQLAFAAAAAALRAGNVDRTTNKVAAPSVLPDGAGDNARPRLVRADVLTAPPSAAPLQAPPAIQPDRLEEVSPAQAAPDVAALPSPVTTPSTAAKSAAPDAATGDARDLSPQRGAPRQAYKRPRSIGPEANRAPTRVPQPVEEISAPAEAEPEVPSASAGESTTEPAAEEKPALPDAAPARAGAPSVVHEPADTPAPARGAPRRIEPVPVAALPAAKDAPTELQAEPVAPAVVAPNAPVGPDLDIAEAKTVPPGAVSTAPIQPPAMAAPSAPAPAPGEVQNAAAPVAPARSAPSGALLTAPVHAPATGAPAELPVPTATVPNTAAPAPAELVRPAPPVAPAAPATVSPAPREKAEVAPDAPADPQPAQPSTPG